MTRYNIKTLKVFVLFKIVPFMHTSMNIPVILFNIKLFWKFTQLGKKCEKVLVS